MLKDKIGIENEITKGENAFKHGDLNLANSIFLECLATEPENARLLNNLGVLACESGNLPQAEEYLKKACAVNHSCKKALVNLWEILDAQSRAFECLNYLESYLELNPLDSEIKNLLEEIGNAAFKKASQVALRVAWRNRGDMEINLGGDCTVINEVTHWLKKQGHRADLRLENSFDHSDYELIHLNNISRSQDTLEHLHEAKKKGKKTVLTSLYEDMDRYLIPSIRTDILFQYLMQQNKNVPLNMIENLRNVLELNSDPLANPINRKLGIGDKKKQGEILRSVDLILTSGKVESEVIKNKFIATAPIHEIPYGFNRSFANAKADLFINKYGLKDFAICVGRFEPRKNQYQLIEIFRNLPKLTLVLVGVFSNPSIESQIKAYAPKNVHFISRLSLEELAAAYAASRMHILPSWYELPGLVSLEAAAAGTRVVTTDWGTARDYFGDLAFYISPDDPVSMQKVILEAFDTSPSSKLREHVLEKFSWEKTATLVSEFYRELLNK